MENVVIFGGSSEIGIRLSKHLSKNGYKIIATGRKESIEEIENVSYISGNILDESLYKNLPQNNVYAVINFAGVQPSIIPMNEKEEHKKVMQHYVDVNIKGVGNILEYCRMLKTDRYLFATSHRELERYWQNGMFISSNFPVNINFEGDHAMYAISKYSSSLFAEYYKLKFGFKVFNFRFPMIYSASESDKYLVDGEEKIKPYLKIIRMAMNAEPLEVWGNPKMMKDYVHIDNVINIIHNALKVQGISNGNYNVGTGEAVTTENFIKEIGDVFYPKGKNMELVYKPDMPAYKCAIYDVKKEMHELNYKPILLREMLLRIKKEIEENSMIEKWGWQELLKGDKKG